jgi:Cof subfamily protein (haloacid dehalogenase superfamily)
MKPSLLAIDIDGTLLDSNYQLPDVNLTALQHAHASGVEIILVTGRRHAFALPIVAELGFELWLISSNGAITRSSRGQTFYRDLLPVAVARQLCAEMADFRQQMVFTFDIEGRGALIVERVNALNQSISRWMEKNAGYIELFEPIENALRSDPVQGMFCGPISLMQKAEQRLLASALIPNVTVLKTQYNARDLCILDVLNQGCSKGHALRRWAEFRGITPQAIVAIGDNYNDAEMLNFAGRAFIMENACEELKQNGWSVAPSNDCGGVAGVIEQVLE